MTDIATILDQWFLDTREEREPDGKLHPSSLSGCWRQAIYEAKGVPPSDEKEVRNLRIMWFGTALHELLQGALGEGFLPEVEVQPSGWPLSGSADGILPIGRDDGDTVYELLEFKSISPFQLKRKDFTGVKPHHERQARMYMWGLCKQGYDILRARVVYISRDDMQMREFILDRDEEWEVDFESELLLHRNLFLKDTDMLPPRLPEDHDTAWLCKYCQYRTRCWEQDSDTRRVDA